MDETARKMLPYIKEYTLKRRKISGEKCGKLPPEELFFVQWGMVM